MAYINALAPFAENPFMMGTPGFNPNAPDPRQAGLPQQPQAKPRKGGFMNTVGRIGDVLALMGGRTPVYSTMQAQEAARAKQEAMQNALAQFAANPDDPAGFNALLLLDPERAIAIRNGLQGEAYTLGEGQVRFQGNREIARGPEKLDTIEVDGVVFDKRSGQPLFESPYDRIIAGPDGSFYRVPRMGLGRQAGGQQEPGQAVTSGGPQPGAVVNGYRFRGGNPNDRNSWEPVAGGAGSNAGGTFRP